MSKRKFRIDAGRNGGELCIGKVNEDFVNYFIERDESELINFLSEFEFGEPEDFTIPIPYEGFDSWTECDDVEHVTGAYADSTWTVTEVPADGSDDHSYNEKETEIEAQKMSQKRR